MTSNYCGHTNPDTGAAVTSGDCSYSYHDDTGALVVVGPSTPQAPSGANLPIAPKFKANAVVRYNFGLGAWDADVQGAVVYQTQTAPALKTQDQQIIGMQPKYYLLDFSAGVEKDGMGWQFMINNVTDERAQISRFVSCTVSVCQQPYVIPAQPRTFGIKFGQKF